MQVRSLDLFSLKDHPNTLTPLEPDNFLVLLHNLGQVRHQQRAHAPQRHVCCWIAC